MHRLCLFVLLAATPAWSAPTGETLANMDLSAPFATRAPWRVIATQGPETQDVVGDPVPGLVSFCLQPKPDAACEPLPTQRSEAKGPPDPYAEDHEFRTLKIVRSHGLTGQPLLLLQTGSVHSMDGDQLRRTRVFAYRRAENRFAEVFSNATGSNNNQETRFITQGPLAGDIVSATPTEHAPYDYWISVSAFAPGGAYHPILRYRSATRYNDGDPLPVIDSEMVGIERRLRLWRPGMPLPLPPGGCARARLVRMELWCG